MALMLNQPTAVMAAQVTLSIAVLPEQAWNGVNPDEFITDRLASIRSLADLSHRMGADLLLLPEFSLVPSKAFSDKTQMQDFAMEVKQGDKHFDALAELARSSEIAIAFNVTERYAAALYNTSFVVDKNGELHTPYRKINPYFTKIFAAGDIANGGKLFEISGVPIGFLVCYDIVKPHPTAELSTAKLGNKPLRIVLSPVSSGPIGPILRLMHSNWAKRFPKVALVVADLTSGRLFSASRGLEGKDLIEETIIPGDHDAGIILLAPIRDN